MGGDRDGNPNVTSQVTKQVILLSRWEAAKLYEKTLTKIIRSYSMKKCSKKISNQVGESFEPYRVFLRPLRDKIRLTHRSIEQYLIEKKPLNQKILLRSTEEILKPLRVVRESLEQNQNENIASGDLLDLMRRAKCFGINLAKLDIRQESSRHTQLIAELVKKKFNGNYYKFSEDEKINFLKSKLLSKKNCINNFKFSNKENNEVWSTFKILAEEPSECLGAYVISMTTSASDILAVSFLQKEAKIVNKLRVVPLFETLDDLVNANQIMKNLFSKKWYKKLINNKQEVMIGYSDSSKDAGKICASWNQYKAQEQIVKSAKKYGIKVSFFHGRGGSAGRGGGPIQATLRSQPPGSVNGKIRITDQAPNFNIYFYPSIMLGFLESSYKIGSPSYLSIRWKKDQIIESKVLIDSFGNSQTQRNYLIRKRVVQGLGLIMDGQSYPDSIFYQGENGVAELTPIDQQVISVLYDNQIKSGMTTQKLKDLVQNQKKYRSGKRRS